MVRFRVALSAITFAFSVPALAQESTLVQGEVVNLDEVEAGKITIKHGPIPNLGLNEDGKSNDFRPKDRALFRSIKVGEKIRFVAERENGELVVTRIDRP